MSQNAFYLRYIYEGADKMKKHTVYAYELFLKLDFYHLAKEFYRYIFRYTALWQKRFHSRYNFGYGILFSIRKIPYFCPFTAHFGGFKGVFSFVTDKSAIPCPGKTEVADFVSFKISIVQGMILLDKLEFSSLAPVL